MHVCINFLGGSPEYTLHFSYSGEIAFYDGVAGSESSLYVFYKICKWSQRTVWWHYCVLKEVWGMSSATAQQFHTCHLQHGLSREPQGPRRNSSKGLPVPPLLYLQVDSTHGTLISPSEWFSIVAMWNAMRRYSYQRVKETNTQRPLEIHFTSSWIHFLY